MNVDLAGRHIVITGAAGGLGPEVLDAVLAAGATCHVPLRGQGDGLRREARLLAVEGVDLTDEAAVTAFYASCPPLWASIHLAGGFKAAAVLETSLADLRKQLDLNLTTAFLCCREAARNMRINGRQGGGRLVNVGSRAAVVPASGSIAYAVSKAAVGALTRSLAEELEDDAIQVNAILPSIIDTPANRAAMPKADFARWPKPAEVAATIVWLVSPTSNLTSGALLPVYGRG